MIKCVILSTQRSGSTLLADYLSSGDGILIHSELFQTLNRKLNGSSTEPRHYAISYERYKNASLTRRCAHKFSRRPLIERYLNEIYQTRDDLEVVGMKFMYGQARRYPEAMDWLTNNDVRFIHLIRENTLDMILSRELAAKRGTHSMLKELPMIKLRLDPDKVRQELESCAREIDEYRKLTAGLYCHEITYEAFVADMEGEARRMIDFLGVQGERHYSSALKKTNPNPKSETIENYEELAQSLKGTEFEPLL